MSESVVRIKCSAKINNEERFVSGFDAVIGVDDFWPKVSIESHLAAEAHDSSVKLGSFDAAEEMGKIQNSCFTEREEEDISLSMKVTNGEGGELKFKGFLIGSDYSLSTSTVTRSDSAITKAARMSSLNFSAAKAYSYGSVVKHNQPEGSLAAYIKKCTEDLLEGCKIEGETDTLEKKCRKFQYEINKDLIGDFTSLLDNSVESMGWKDLPNKLKSGDYGDITKLGRRIDDIIAGNATGGFETVITKLNEEFQLVYVPAWDGVGQFVNRLKLIDNPTDLKVTIISVTFHTTNGQTLFPIKYVVILPPSGCTYGCMGQPTNFYAFPVDNMKKGASMISVPGPTWLAPKSPPQNSSQEGDKRPTEGQKVENAEAIVKEANTLTEAAQKASGEILKELGKAIYVFQALAGSYVELCTTLKLDVEIGKCYNVKSGDATLFKGVLWRVRHSVSTGGGQSPRAISILEFHIVQMSGFQLPGI